MIIFFFTLIPFIPFYDEFVGTYFGPMPPPHVLVDFVDLAPGHGRCVTDF